MIKDPSWVLIVAKCNVNLGVANISFPCSEVLIVAKCNVNVIQFHHFS